MTTEDEQGRLAPSGRMRLLGPGPSAATATDPTGRPGPRLRRTRAVIAWILVVVSVVLVPVSVVTVWAVNTVTDTNHYVTTLAPLARERVITDYVAVQGTNKLFDSIGVQEKISDVLPKKASFLAGPLTNTMRGFVQEQLTKLLRSTWFHNFWDSANRRSHTALVNVLTGKKVPGQRANQVIVNLTPVLTKVIDQLDARGITIFDGAKAQLAQAQSLTLHLASSKQIAAGRKFFRIASDLGWAAPLLAVIAMVAALVVAVDRRKTLLRIAVGAALLTLLVLAGLALGRSFFLSHAASRVSPSVTGAIFDTLVRFLTHNLRQVLLISVIVAAVLWLIGPARWPRWLRAQAVRGVRWAGQRAAELGNERNRQRASAASRAGAARALEHASGLRLLGVVVAGIVLVFGGNLSVSGVWSTVIGLAAYLVVLELIFAWARRTTGPVVAGPVVPGPVVADSPAPDPLLVDVGAVGLPATVQPLGQEDDGGAQDAGDDDDHDQGGLG